MAVDGSSLAVDDVGDINLANALDLSESEEEEETEDIIDDFSREREVNHCSAHCILSDEDELTHTCAGPKLETRTPVLLPVPQTIPCVRSFPNHRRAQIQSKRAMPPQAVGRSSP